MFTLTPLTHRAV